jgi:hypothetical protein
MSLLSDGRHPKGGTAMRLLRGIGQFWYDFIVGDDWKIAAAVCTVLVIGAVCVLAGLDDSPLLVPLLAVGMGVAFTTAVLVDVRQGART